MLVARQLPATNLKRICVLLLQQEDPTLWLSANLHPQEVRTFPKHLAASWLACRSLDRQHRSPPWPPSASLPDEEVARRDWFCCVFEGETHLVEERGVGKEMQVATPLAMARHPELEQERLDLGKLEVFD